MSVPAMRPDRPTLDALVAAVPPEMAELQARWLRHTLGCTYWLAFVPDDCDCETRPVVDLLLALARRGA